MDNSIWNEIKMVRIPNQYFLKTEEFAECFFWNPDEFVCYMYNSVGLPRTFIANDFSLCKLFFSDDWKVVCLKLPENEEERSKTQRCSSYAVIYNENNEAQGFFAVLDDAKTSAHKVVKLEFDIFEPIQHVLANTKDDISVQAKDIYRLSGRNSAIKSSYEKYPDKDGGSTGVFMDYTTNKATITEYDAFGNLLSETRGTFTPEKEAPIDLHTTDITEKESPEMSAGNKNFHEPLDETKTNESEATVKVVSVNPTPNGGKTVAYINSETNEGRIMEYDDDGNFVGETIGRWEEAPEYDDFDAYIASLEEEEKKRRSSKTETDNPVEKTQESEQSQDSLKPVMPESSTGIKPEESPAPKTKLSKVKFLIIVSITAVLLLAAFAVKTISDKNWDKQYTQAQKLYASGEYAAAAEIFESLGPDASEDWVWSIYQLAASTEDFEEQAELLLLIVDEPTLSEYIPMYLENLTELFELRGNQDLVNKIRVALDKEK